LKIRSLRLDSPECWERVWRLLLQGELVWPEEQPPLAREQVLPEQPLEQALVPGPQWVERIQRRHGIELRKPFR